jgi:hypothetical protein
MQRQTRNQKQKKRKSRRNQRGGGGVQAMIQRFSGQRTSKPSSPKPAGVNTSSNPNNQLKILNRLPELSTENPFPFENFNEPNFNHLRSVNTIQADVPKTPINAAVLNSSTDPHIPYTSSGPPIRGHVNYNKVKRKILEDPGYSRL